ECSIWARDGVRIDPGNKTEAWLYEESRRMMKAYGNHPSFILLSHGNEPEGRWTEALPRWVEYWKERDGRRLYAACTGVAMRPELGPSSGTQYLIVGRIGSNPARGTAGWNGKDYRTTIQGVDVPIITHELGQHAVYPNFDEMKKYVGLFKPRNFEFFRQSLEDHGMLNRYREFVAATGRLQVLGYKEDVEACLRTPGLAGFQLLDLHDYPGQGTSLIGVLDAFWDRKAYTHPEEYRRFCDTTVVLARLNSRTLTQKQTLIIKVETAHSGEAAIAGAVAAWRILDKNNNTAASGEMPPQSIPFGTGNPLGTIDVDLSRFAAPQQYRLVIGLKNTNIENDWNFWVYPDSTDLGPADGILLASSFDRNVLDVLEKGGKVLLCPLSSRLAWDSPPFNFAPIFWNRQLFPKWDRSMGLRCDPKHPALAGFPTDYSSDWQWESLIRPGCRAISLENLPKSLEPIVRSIDDYNRNERQGLVFECKVGKGSLLVCAFDLEADAPVLPAKRQFKASLLKYMRSPLFRPSVQVLPAQIASLFFDNGIMALLGTKASADAEAPMNPVQNLIDGNPTTAWLTPSRGGVKGFPHEVILTLEQSVSVAGFVCMAQQRDRKRIGEVKDYVVCLRTGSGEWKEAKRGVLKAAFSPQRVLLDRPMKTDGIKFTALSSHDGGPVAAMAEFALIMEEGLLKPSEEKTQDKKKEKGVHPDEIDGNTGGPSTQ
ncbi:MAG TPA: discoidin domain-containing protein, partial [bacterium]